MLELDLPLLLEGNPDAQEIVKFVRERVDGIVNSAQKTIDTLTNLVEKQQDKIKSLSLNQKQ